MSANAIKKTLSSNKAIVLQTIALILTLLGIAIAAERRITTIEVKTADEIKARVESNAAIIAEIKRLQDSTSELAKNQVRSTTMLDAIDKRHALEDQRRSVVTKGTK